MTAWNTETIRDLLIEAGRIALEHFETPRTERKADRSLVTVADRAVENYLTDCLLQGNDPGVMVLGEESAGDAVPETIASLHSGITWIVDPIDGTTAYANRLPTWGISLGRVETGRFTDGALFLPCTGEMFITRGADVLYEKGSRDPAQWRFDHLKPLSAPPRPYTSTGMVSLPHEIAFGARFEGNNPFQATGSAVYSLAQLFLGGYLAYVARIKLWDVAGAIPILLRLGFLVEFPDRKKLGHALSDEDWVLDAENPRLWRSSGMWIIARTQETLDIVREQYHPARDW